ncbi:MAG: FAD-binding protein [Acidimicrobiia bacterium]
MVVAAGLGSLADAVREAPRVVAVGSRTHWEVGNPPATEAIEVRAPDGIVAYEPADLTVTVGAGTSVQELADLLAAHGQEVALDPRSALATVGGVIATGLSGYRRLRWGPLRDRVLEVRFVNADGDIVKGGGPTVKNVSGFDLPRLLVGSFGTIGVLTQLTLRCQPIARLREWSTTRDDPCSILRRAYRPSAVMWNGQETRVLVEGVAADIDAQRAAMGSTADDSALAFPEGRHRGRISVRPSALPALGPRLDDANVRWLAEIGIGTVHVAADEEADLDAARREAEAAGGWMLREAGAPGIDGFGRALPNARLQARISAAFDPEGKFSPGRMGSPALKTGSSPGAPG